MSDDWHILFFCFPSFLKSLSLNLIPYFPKFLTIEYCNLFLAFLIP